MAADARRLDKERRGRGKKRGGRRKEELQKEAPYHHELIWHYKEGHIPICSHTLYCITYMKQDIAQSHYYRNSKRCNIITILCSPFAAGAGLAIGHPVVWLFTVGFDVLVFLFWKFWIILIENLNGKKRVLACCPNGFHARRYIRIGYRQYYQYAVHRSPRIDLYTPEQVCKSICCAYSDNGVPATFRGCGLKGIPDTTDISLIDIEAGSKVEVSKSGVTECNGIYIFDPSASPPRILW